MSDEQEELLRGIGSVREEDMGAGESSPLSDARVRVPIQEFINGIRSGAIPYDTMRAPFSPAPGLEMLLGEICASEVVRWRLPSGETYRFFANGRSEGPSPFPVGTFMVNGASDIIRRLVRYHLDGGSRQQTAAVFGPGAAAAIDKAYFKFCSEQQNDGYWRPDPGSSRLLELLGLSLNSGSEEISAAETSSIANDAS